jgi:hypothetical protein
MLQSNGFWPLALIYEHSRVYRDSNSQRENSLGSVRVHSLTLSYTPKSMRCDSRASFLVRTLASPCLGCEPKARVATTTVLLKYQLVQGACKIKEGDLVHTWICYFQTKWKWLETFLVKLPCLNLLLLL